MPVREAGRIARQFAETSALVQSLLDHCDLDVDHGEIAWSERRVLERRGGTPLAVRRGMRRRARKAARIPATSLFLLGLDSLPPEAESFRRLGSAKQASPEAARAHAKDESTPAPPRPDKMWAPTQTAPPSSPFWENQQAVMSDVSTISSRRACHFARRGSALSARARISGFPWDLLGTAQVDNIPLTRVVAAELELFGSPTPE